MLYPKKGQVWLEVYKERTEKVGQIAVPQIANQTATPKFQIIGFAHGSKEENLHVGSVVLLENMNDISTVKLSFNGVLTYVADVVNIVAEFPDLFDFSESSEPKERYFDEIGEHGQMFKASGDSLVIAPYPKLDFTSIGGILVPLAQREVQRSHVGTIITIGSKAAEKTGFEPGQVVIYDYYGAFGHEWKYDVVRSENVLAALSVYGHEQMMKFREQIGKDARI